MTADIKDRIEQLITGVYQTRNSPCLWDVCAVLFDLFRAEMMIRELPDDDHDKMGFFRRALYNRGLVFREVGLTDHLLVAASIHEQAAAIAPTEAKGLIELVVAAVERMHHAVETNDPVLLNEQLEALRTHEGVLRAENAATPDDEAAKWLSADIPAHRAYCSALMDVSDYPEHTTDMDALRRLPENLRPSYRVWEKIVDGLRLLRIHDVGALAVADDVLKNGGSHPTHRCFGLYIAGCAILDQRNIWIGACLLQQAVDYPAHGAHFVRAAAQRKLDALGRDE